MSKNKKNTASRKQPKSATQKTRRGQQRHARQKVESATRDNAQNQSNTSRRHQKPGPNTPQKTEQGRLQNTNAHQKRAHSTLQSPSALNQNAGRNDLWLYGRHAVLSALTNSARQLKRLIVSDRHSNEYHPLLTEIIQHHDLPPVELMPPAQLDHLLPEQSVHQGIALLTKPLPSIALEDACQITSADKGQFVMVLDQVTDPQNVGAIIRSASAFGACALVTIDRNSPPESGALAKSASGALEALPWVRVINLARALDQLSDMGYWRIGLDGYATTDIDKADLGRHLALVLGAEGKGLRKGTKEHCDLTVRLPITRTVESLNVSNAAAIALYDFSRRTNTT